MRVGDGRLRPEEGLLLVRQDVLRGVHWRAPDVAEVDLDDEDAWERSGRAVEEADIPTATGVHQLATAADAQRGVLGHSTVRVTQDLYIAPDADLYDRFYQATG